jgi:hypothetical protein
MWLGSVLLLIGLLMLSLNVIVWVAKAIFSLAMPLAVVGLVVFLIGWLLRKARY